MAQWQWQREQLWWPWQERQVVPVQVMVQVMVQGKVTLQVAVQVPEKVQWMTMMPWWGQLRVKLWPCRSC